MARTSVPQAAAGRSSTSTSAPATRQLPQPASQPGSTANCRRATGQRFSAVGLAAYPRTMPVPQRVALVTLGCARNEVDSEELAGRLDADGWQLVKDPADADAVLVNTCGFVEAAKKDSVDTLLAAADLKVSGRVQAVAAVGCMAERYGKELASALPEADAVLGFDDYADIGGRLRSLLDGGAHVSHSPRDRRQLLSLTPV